MLFRSKLLKEYVATKKKDLSPDVLTTDPLKLFLIERDTLKTFNKVILNDQNVRSLISTSWPALRSTGKRDIPLIMGFGDGAVPIVESVHAAEKILSMHEDSEIEIGFIGLFQSSSYREGISKRSGRQWKKVDVVISDGMANIECTWWDKKKALRLPTDSIVYARGILKKDWRGRPSINLNEIVRAGSYDNEQFVN